MVEFRVISTIGPASRNAAFLRVCQEVGQAHLRINGSHLDAVALEASLSFLQPFGAAVTVDLQGRKQRIGELSRPLELAVNEVVELVAGDRAADGAVPLPDPALFVSLREGDLLILMDRQVELVVEDRSEASVHARVKRAQPLRSRAGIYVAGRPLGAVGLPPSQLAQVELARRFQVDALALSYVSEAGELEALRSLCRASGYSPRLVAKLETPEAVRSLESIAAAADELWLCRGDLGSIVSGKELAALQFKVLREAQALVPPCLVAGQVFHHLTHHEEPTRSEVVHLAELRERGARGIVLSDETAIGVNPENALRQVLALV